LGGLALALAALWAIGGFDAFSAWVMDSQRAVQGWLAGAIRALRAGQAGAWAAFLGLCFAYGVLHAAGPGHGKLVIGGYGAARRITARKLALLALVSSMAQAAVAVMAVYAIVAALGLSRQVAGEVVDGIIAPLGSAAIAALGLYLIWRGARGVLAQPRAYVHPSHTPRDSHDDACGCGHAHAPSAAQVQAASTAREMAALVAGIALRPCTGAVFVLILTWQLGLALAGIAGAFAMGFGTALFTAGAALMAVYLRDGAMGSLSLGQMARVLPMVEMTAGAVIALGAGAALAAAL
jgi:ABC-type nickel/cobalt efflux system permease component RcnA